MLGLAGACTPAVTGNVLIMIRGDLVDSTTGDCVWQIHYGTGTAPSNGAASTGTAAGAGAGPSANSTTAFTVTLTAYVTGLTPSTAYWFDVSAQTLTTSITCTISNPQLIEIEE